MTTRAGELKSVFKGGESELLNEIARLAIFYEDLRLEINELRILHRRIVELGEPNLDYNVSYYLRRSLATLVEFRGTFVQVKQCKEFRESEHKLNQLHATYISEADKFFNKNWARIKDLRNEFAGHIQASAVKFATKNFDRHVGTITWNPAPESWATEIECDFAGMVLNGVISSKLQAGRGTLDEWQKALEMISSGFNHAQAAMVALVHAFLLDRFGK